MKRAFGGPTFILLLGCSCSLGVDVDVAGTDAGGVGAVEDDGGSFGMADGGTGERDAGEGDAGESDAVVDEEVSECASNYDCPLDQFCDRETERQPGPPGVCVEQTPGVHCADGDDCEEGEVCVNLSIIIGPRGFCVDKGAS